MATAAEVRVAADGELGPVHRAATTAAAATVVVSAAASGGGMVVAMVEAAGDAKEGIGAEGLAKVGVGAVAGEAAEKVEVLAAAVAAAAVGGWG